MKTTKFGQNFFGSTRGRVLDAIRGGVSTVDELAQTLGLTDNAVRAHLATLERDRLVEQHGFQPGPRKPHFSYRLTSEAEYLFPKAYHTLLGTLLVVLKNRLDPDQLNEIMKEVAAGLVLALSPKLRTSTAETRAESAVAVLEELGGSSRVEKDGDRLFVRSNSGCPFSEVVNDHPEICRLAEMLLSEITGTPVCESCERGEAPRCTFEISGTGQTRA